MPHLLLIRFHLEIEGVLSAEVLGIATEELQEIFGIPVMGQEPAAEEAVHTEELPFRKKRKRRLRSGGVISEFKYVPLDNQVDHIGEERKNSGILHLMCRSGLAARYAV